ncbi:hypothetical protein [Metamycoplasma salivarium]|uniref:hypothetical protein n=1 Tax=Metamycoplasma salivarium TaxID=2124 RepID=UPI001F3CA8AF|nr:hypothetical protein [Metamycoplasma salivarium]GIZ06677.1 hypothetical protein MSATCC33130_0310 [Metamycoplasma salivarium]
MITKEQMIQEMTKSLRKNSSQWDRGVLEYAKELMERLVECGHNNFEENFTDLQIFGGAANARQYSYGACSLIYDDDIAKRLCTPSEYKRVTANGKRHIEIKRPNKDEPEWLDTQTRALYQAKELIKRTQSILQSKRSNAYDLSKIDEAKSEVKSILSSSNNQTQTKTNNR